MIPTIMSCTSIQQNSTNLTIAKGRKRCFTLVEVLIVIAILGLIATVGALKTHEAVREQSFHAEVQLVLDELRLAQDLMLISGAEVHVNFAAAKEKPGIDTWLSFDIPLPPEIHLPSDMTKKQTLTYTHFVSFAKDENPEIDLMFLSRGVVMSKGILRMSTSRNDDEKGALTNYISLTGHPQPIHAVLTKPDELESEMLENQINNHTVEEVRALSSV